MGRLPQAPSWGFALDPDTAGSARSSPGRAPTHPVSAIVSRSRSTVVRHPAIRSRSSVPGAEVAPNKCINLTRPRAETSFNGTARRLCARRYTDEDA